MWFCLHVFSVCPNPTSAKQRSTQYASICNRLSEMWEGFGALAVTHSILQKCMLGLLPLWCLDLAVIGSDTRAIRFFNEKFPIQRQIKGAETDRFVRTVSTRFELKYRTPFSFRLLEIFFCKAYRELTRLLEVSGNITRAVEMIGKSTTQTNQRFCDLLVPSQIIFKSSGLGLLVIFPDGSSTTLEAGSIFERMPFGNDLLTMEEMAKEMRLATTAIPSDTTMAGLIFDRKLVFPLQSLQVDFQFPTLPQLDETGKGRARNAIGRYVTGVNPLSPRRTNRPTRRAAV